jgi:hypothetical protein
VLPGWCCLPGAACLVLPAGAWRRKLLQCRPDGPAWLHWPCLACPWPGCPRPEQRAQRLCCLRRRLRPSPLATAPAIRRSSRWAHPPSLPQRLDAMQQLLCAQCAHPPPPQLPAAQPARPLSCPAQLPSPALQRSLAPGLARGQQGTAAAVLHSSQAARPLAARSPAPCPAPAPRAQQPLLPAWRRCG